MVIEGAASSLLDGPDAPVNPVYLERVAFLIAEARQMSDTVNKILDMTRLESAPVQLDRRWYPLETLVLGALNHHRDCLSRHVVKPALPGEPLWVHVDALVFEKLLTNLLENAAKYSEAGSCIGISAACTGNTIEIRVTDQGCGFPPGDTDAIFGKFYRGTHPGAVPGIGLGLSICRAVALLHGGRITARRRATDGAEFVVELPRLPDAPVVPADFALGSAR
jgi:two-component system sensor histidine kinase KdpD